MEAFFVPLLPPVAMSLALWAWIIWISFRATGRGMQRTTAAVSVLLSICGAIAFLGFSGSDDYNVWDAFRKARF
ncbi:MAG: hypothetical protein ACR2MR_01425 [Dietzia maris]